MKVCKRCKNRPFFDDENVCTAKDAPISNPVTGAKCCEDINTDGKCVYYVESRRHLLVVAFVALAIAGLVAFFGWWTMTGDTKAIEREARASEREVNAIERATQPTKIYDVERLPNGNYRVKEYQPYRGPK